MRIATPFCGITWVWYNELQCLQWKQNMRKIILRNYLYDNALQKTTFLCCKNHLFALQEGGTTLVFVVVLLLFSPLIITYPH